MGIKIRGREPFRTKGSLPLAPSFQSSGKAKRLYDRATIYEEAILYDDAIIYNRATITKRINMKTSAQRLLIRCLRLFRTAVMDRHGTEKLSGLFGNELKRQKLARDSRHTPLVFGHTNAIGLNAEMLF